jgi:hypothetical protein
MIASERDGYGRRKLTEPERDALLDLPLTGVLSTLTPAGRIHSVPVHFLRNGGDLRMLVERDSVKSRNARRSGRATLCVETTIGEGDRRYVTAEGPVSVDEPISRDDLTALDRRYDRRDAAGFDQASYEDSAMLVLHPERWIAWSDAD